MTRLRSDDILNISEQLNNYDNELIKKTGFTLSEIASFALNIEKEELEKYTRFNSIAVIPIRSGKGVISGFANTVKDILRHIGFDAMVTEATDVSGIAEAAERGIKIIMMADDFRFVALRLDNGFIVDNASATAKGFVAGLDLMAGGLDGKDIIVIGCGPVGRNAASFALERGALVSVFDINITLCKKLETEMKRLLRKKITIIEPDNRGEISFSNFKLLVDATNAANIFKKSDLNPSTYIAAPGMPLGISDDLFLFVKDRLLHDPLQLGVAVMGIEAARGYKYEKKQ